MELKPHQIRFIKEYCELVERIGKLDDMLLKWQTDQLTFVPDCTYEQLSLQLDAMKLYKHTLENRNDFQTLTREEGAFEWLRAIEEWESADKEECANE